MDLLDRIFPSDPEGDAFADGWVDTLLHPNLVQPVYVYGGHACTTDRRSGSPYSHHTPTCRLYGPCDRHRPHECDPARCDSYDPESDHVIPEQIMAGASVRSHD